MKCGYNKCKFGGNVDKKDAIKDGTRYFHKECLHEKKIKHEIESYYRNNFNTNEPLQNVRSAISSFVHKNMYDADYVLWCLKNKAKKLNSIFGLSYSLSYIANYEEFVKEKINKIEIKLEAPSDEEYLKTTPIQPKKNKNWGDFFG